MLAAFSEASNLASGKSCFNVSRVSSASGTRPCHKHKIKSIQISADPDFVECLKLYLLTANFSHETSVRAGVMIATPPREDQSTGRSKEAMRGRRAACTETSRKNRPAFSDLGATDSSCARVGALLPSRQAHPQG